MAVFLAFGVFLASSSLWGGAVRAESTDAIALPSGAVAQWLETRHDSASGEGLTYRFRFVVPDLAQRVPSTSGSASDFDMDDDARGPIDIDTETGEVSGDTAAALAGADLPKTDAGDEPMPDTDEEAAADAMIEQPVVPADPDLLAQDPVHGDVVWLCENWALPRIASPGPRPQQIVISLASKPLPFGSLDPEAVQLFEAFHLPADRDTCEWEPW